MSIDSQIEEMMTLAKRDKLKIKEVKKESHSAKSSGTRPVFMGLLQDLVIYRSEHKTQGGNQYNSTSPLSMPGCVKSEGNTERGSIKRCL